RGLVLIRREIVQEDAVRVRRRFVDPDLGLTVCDFAVRPRPCRRRLRLHVQDPSLRECSLRSRQEAGRVVPGSTYEEGGGGSRNKRRESKSSSPRAPLDQRQETRDQRLVVVAGSRSPRIITHRLCKSRGRPSLGHFARGMGLRKVFAEEI